MVYLKSLFLIIIISLVSCDDKPDRIYAEKHDVSFDADILNKLMSFPRYPISVKWETRELNNKEAGSLVALLEYSEQEYHDIVKSSKPFDTVRNDRLAIYLYDTFLPDKSKQGIHTQSDGVYYELLNVSALHANIFTNSELSPYVNGSVTPLSNGFVLVSLYSM